MSAGGEAATRGKGPGRDARPLLSVRGLEVTYRVGRRLLGAAPALRALAGVDLDVPRGSALGLVGESGSGKTTLGRAVLGAAPVSAGTIRYDDGELACDPTRLGRDAPAFRRRAQMVFQDPHAALSPRMTVRDVIAEPLEVMRLTRGRAETDARVREIARRCRLDLAHLRRFPHAFSGGQRQRIAVARALAPGPRLVVADEAVAALDVSIQADVLNLFADLRRDLDLTLLFISHDLAVVAHLCDRVAVLYLGRIVETAPTDALFAGPRHPYTRALLAAIPSLDPDEPMAPPLPGEIPSPADPPPGCRFHTRCPHARERCRVEMPALEEAPGGARVACHYWRDLDA